MDEPDGVVQAPGAADEDTSGRFRHGGWHLRYFDEASQNWVVENIRRAEGGYLLGRRTYETLGGYWPNASEEEQVIAEPLNTRPKHVASRTLAEPLAWENSRLLEGDVAEAVAALKAKSSDLLVIGSTQLAPTLAEHGLVDEYRLMIDPVVLGGGKRIFPDDGELRALRLVESEVTTTGALLATYAPA